MATDNIDPNFGPKVDLPLAVENLVEQIRSKDDLPPLRADDRRKLAADGEDEALRMLGVIAASKTPVRTLPGYLAHLRNQKPPPPPQPLMTKSSSPLSSPSRSSSLSPPPSKSPKFLTVRYFATPPGGETVARSLFPEPTAMEALGELEFRKQFLILNYTAGNELEKVISAEQIRSLKELEMLKFEERLWDRFGGQFVNPDDRVWYSDWNPETTHIYDCHVSPEGSYRFKGPFLEKTRTHLQKVLGDDNVLRVKFAEGVTSGDHFYAGYGKIAREGIPVGLRLYRFFVFKDGGKEKKKESPNSSPVKCYFVRTDSKALIDENTSYILSNKTISQARKMFMHAHTVSNVSNYMARFSLILSKTHSLGIDLSSVKVDFIEDVYCLDESGNCIYRDEKPLIHTDGTGFISEDLALMCPKNIYKGRCTNNENTEIFNNSDELEDNILKMEHQGFGTHEPPMLIQFHMFYNGYAIKGTFLVNKKLAPRTIQIRDSMIKVGPDPELSNYPTRNSLEVVTTSNPPKKPTLSRNLIALLSHGGVPDEFFTDLLSKALREGLDSFSNKRAAFKVAMNYGNMDSDFTVARMIACGIPLEEPFLQHRLSVLMKEENRKLGLGKLHVPDCFYLIGTTDPTGKLKSDEVCVVLDNGQVSGKVLVYRNPGLHFGDIHVLKATYVEELESFVGNAKYAIFFSQSGARSVADEIAGRDFDGDPYWVSRNSELLKYFKPSEPWIQKPSTGKVEIKKRPRDLTDEELEDELIKLFLKTRFQPSFTVGIAARSWCALMDRFLTLGDDNLDEKNAVKENLIKLIDIYYDALDAPKKGATIEVPKELQPKMFPHYMEGKYLDWEKLFKSKSILGKIYDDVNKYIAQDRSEKQIWKVPCFDVRVPEDCWNKWKEYYEQYRREMSNVLNNNENNVKNMAAERIKKDYKKRLYDAEELEESTRNIDDIFNEAPAIYNLSYDYAISKNEVSRCSFAWNVAGSALFKLYASKGKGERGFIFSPSVLKELF